MNKIQTFQFLFIALGEMVLVLKYHTIILHITHIIIDFKNPNELLKPASSYGRDKHIIFISSNCMFSGASARSMYVEELMKCIIKKILLLMSELEWRHQYIPVDSYGMCHHNTDWPQFTMAKNTPTFKDMTVKIDLMKQYKIVLAFENNNVTDYVTEKVFNAFQAGISSSSSFF